MQADDDETLDTCIDPEEDKTILKRAKQGTHRESARRIPALAVWPFVLVILTQMAVGGFSVYTLSATRALVAGESLWSKGQHEAVYFLNLYLDTENTQYLALFKRAIAIPLDYRRGREALEKTPPDPAAARQAFANGGSAAEDIPSGVWIIRHFRGAVYLRTAFQRWKETDEYILELARLGEAIEAEHSISDAGALRGRLEVIDAAITPRANAFSQALVEAARVVERSLLFANFGLAALLTTLTVWRVGRVIRQQRASETALAWQASHDDLTGLLNRRVFEQRLAEILHGAGCANRDACALFFIDLDQFKIVNDTCGHAAGDALLRNICSPLQDLLGPTEIVARLGGDEFGILVPRTSMEAALHLAEQVRLSVERFEFVWHGRRFGITASIGLVHREADATSLEEMMSKADMACFMAKEKGRNRIHLHRNEDQDLLGRMHEMNWVQRIQQALDEERLCLFAQDIVAVSTPNGDEAHVEILLRMFDEAGALVPPSSFIPAAERFGLMKSVDRWVVDRTFRTLAERKSVPGVTPIVCCAINLSGSTVGDQAFLGFLKQAFAKHGIAPHTICFELTETAAVVNLAAARTFIRDLRTLGCTFALDDFGAGMSSFTYLKELPVDYLKIDGAFVRNLLVDPADRAIVEMISRVGQTMGKRIIAEFVQSDAVVDVLRTMGVDYAQGYGIASPKRFDAHFSTVTPKARQSRHRGERLSA